jgi:hypothetical protein
MADFGQVKQKILLMASFGQNPEEIAICHARECAFWEPQNAFPFDCRTLRIERNAPAIGWSALYLDEARFGF